MKFTINGIDFHVTWVHYQDHETDKTKGLTTCRITEGEHGHNDGHAYCSKKDAFCKKTGRKVSFGNALDIFPRPMRTKFWNAYFEKWPLK